jgi:hypothetical protein
MSNDPNKPIPAAGRNPHYRREVTNFRKHWQARDPLTGKATEPVEVDCVYANPDYQKPIPCGRRGEPAWKNAGTAMHTCPACGSYLCHGEWLNLEDPR